MNPRERLRPRHLWFLDRTKACLDELYELHQQESWEAYKLHARELCKELSYCVNEWDRYYKENE